jgi:hypothetical protein
MMIECPRCGFAQPKDQYCASCGVNMDQLLAKPKPIMVRLLQNPNFHLSLIGALIAVVVAWIFYTQSSVVSRQLGRVLDLPVSSKNAADPDDAAGSDNEAAAKAVAEENAGESAEPEALSAPAATPVSAAAIGESRSPEEILADAVGAPSPNTKVPTKIELSSFEVPRETLAALVQPPTQRVTEGPGARVYYIPPGGKAADTLQTAAQALGAGKSAALAANAQLIQTTAATAPEMFQFNFQFQVTKTEAKDSSIRFVVNYVLPQPEPPGETGPAMRQVMESNVSGNANVVAGGLLVIVMDPPNRSPREEFQARAGEGPWSVLSSPEFRAGVTDWILVFQLK